MNKICFLFILCLLNATNICAINNSNNTEDNLKVDEKECNVLQINKTLVHHLTVGSTYYDGDSLVLTSTSADFASNKLLEEYYVNYVKKLQKVNAEMKCLSKESKERAMIDFPFYCQQADSIILSKPVTIVPVADHTKKDLFFRYGVGPMSKNERANAKMEENVFLFVFTPFGSVDIVWPKNADVPDNSSMDEKLIVVNGKPVALKHWHTLFYPEVRDEVDVITFMSGEDGAKAYGVNGQNGVILITMKSGYSDDLLQEWAFRSSLIELTTYGRYFLYLVM